MLPSLLILCLPSLAHGALTPPAVVTPSTSNIIDEEFEALVAEVDAAVAAWELQLEAARERLWRRLAARVQQGAELAQRDP